MNRTQVVADVLAQGPIRLSGAMRAVFVVLALAGLGGIASGWIMGRPAWSFEALLVATLVMAGLSQVGIVWSAVIQITNARWGRSYRRIMELTLMGAPVTLAGLVILFATSSQWAPFAGQHLEGGKGLWLSVPFWALRNGIAVAGLFALSGYYLYHCMRPDLGLAKEQGREYPGGLGAWMIREWKGAETEIARSTRIRTWLAPVLCIAYALVYTMVGFDLVMALDVYWYSTLFGAYHFIGNVYMGLAFTILLAAVMRRRIEPEGFFSAKHFGILGAMLFAFCFLLGDFFWSQFLTIYYGNLPEETEYVLLRTMNPDYPWRYLAWATLAGFFGIPFVALLFRAVKWVPARVAPVAILILLAMIAERFLTTAPPILGLEPGAGIWDMLVPLGLALLACLGFVAMGGLFYGWLMKQGPMLPISDPLLMESLKDNEDRPR
jgi:hypothetical protein